MSRFSIASVLSRTVYIIFGLFTSIAVQAGTFTNTSTALTAPASSSTGNYTVSFKTSAWGTHHLQEKKNSGSWSNIKTYVTDPNGTTTYPSITRNVSVSGRTSGTYSYRVRFVAPSNSTLSSGYSNIKITVVSLTPGIPASISAPTNDNDGAFTVSWGAASGTVTSYKLEQQLNSGSWSEIYSGTNLSEALTGVVDGTYQYRVKACNSEGCSDYRTSSNNTLVLHPLGTPTNLTVPIGDADGAYTITWQPGQGTATTYTLQEQINSGTWTTVQDTADTSYIVSGKTNNQYSYKVRACNAGGCTDYTAAQTLEVKMVGQPGAITGPSNLQEVDDFTLAWGTASGTVTHFELEEQASG